MGKVRNAVERCHKFFAQFERVGRRLDRGARNYLGWCQVAACVIFRRSGFVRESLSHFPRIRIQFVLAIFQSKIVGGFQSDDGGGGGGDVPLSERGGV